MYEDIIALSATPRMERVRERILTHPVARAENVYGQADYPLYYSGDRWLTPALLEGWEKGASETTLLRRRAFAEAYALDHAEAVIRPEELILGELDVPDLPEEKKKAFLRAAEEFKKYAPDISRGRHDHICMDFPKLLKCGVVGILAEIREKRASLVFDDPVSIRESYAKKEFYDCCETELEALLRFAAKYAAKARSLADAEKDPVIAENYRAAAGVLDRVPANPARTFREALQSVHFYIFNLFGLYPAGKMDDYLYAYYEKDLASGILTKEFAQELIDNFGLLISTYVFSRASDSIVLAGRDASGRKIGNALTAHFLRSIAHIRRPDPNFTFAVTEDPDPELFAFAVRNALDGTTHPAFYNDKGISRSLVRHGVSEEDSHLYTNTTCSEITICGKTRALTTCPFVNCLPILSESLHSGREFQSADELFADFEERLKRLMDQKIVFFNEVMLDRARTGAEPFRVSCLVDDCIARGRSIWEGGAKYNVILPSFYGVSNTAEAISTYDHLVFQSKEYTQSRITEIVDANYEGHEELRQRIIRRLPHYGNADAKADEYMLKLTDILQRVCKGYLNLWGGPVVPGAFPYMMHSSRSACAEPSADGRRAGEALASCPGPLNGFDMQGPTSSLYSSSAWRQTEFLGGITMNICFQKTLLDDVGIERVEGLIQGFFAREGKQLQINVLSAEQLEDALLHPEQHENLIVRVGGYSEYFNRLSDTLKKEIVRRTRM